MTMVLRNGHAYLGYFIAALKNMLSYRLGYALWVLSKLGTSLVMVFVWTAIYAASGAHEIGGFTIVSMYAYFFLFSLISSIDTNISPKIQDDVDSGNAITSLVKPTSYPLQLFSAGLAELLLASLMVTLPGIIIIGSIVPLNISWSSLSLLAIEMFVFIALAALIDFLIGLLAFYTTQIWGIINVTNSLVIFLSGGIMPLGLLPSGISKVLMLLPFQMMGYTQIETLLGLLNVSAIMQNIAIGAAWAFALFIIALAMWNGTKRHITLAGG